MTNTDLALRILQLCNQGIFITFGHCKRKVAETDEVDDYYMITTRLAGEDYKRHELPRDDIVLALHNGQLPQLLISYMEKL